MTATVTFPTAEQARFVADIAGTANGATVTLTDDDLDRLAEQPEDLDGHYDGTYVWIGGSEYEVSGRMVLDGAGYGATLVRATPAEVAALDSLAAQGRTLTDHAWRIGQYGRYSDIPERSTCACGDTLFIALGAYVPGVGNMEFERCNACGESRWA